MPAHDVSVVSPSDVYRPPLLVLLASALLGPTAWHPVAEALRAMGRDVIVVPPEDALVPATADEASDLYDRYVPTDRALILVPHSNAGNFVPALIGSRKVAAVVFVDSVIPVAFGVQNLAPPEFLAEIDQLADEDGMLNGCINDLDQRDAQFIRSAFMGGVTYTDLAARESQPLGTVKSRIRRALIKLRLCMEGQL